MSDSVPASRVPGPVGVTPKGVWSAGAYDIRSLVEHERRLWWAKRATSARPGHEGGSNDPDWLSIIDISMDGEDIALAVADVLEALREGVPPDRDTLKKISDAIDAADAALKDDLLAEMAEALALKVDKDLSVTLDVITIALDPVDLSDPPAVINGYEFEGGELFGLFGQTNKVQNGLYEVAVDEDTGAVSFTRPSDYAAGAVFAALSLRVLVLDGEDYVGEVYELRNAVTVDLTEATWARYTGQLTTARAGTFLAGPAMDRSAPSIPKYRRLVSTDLPLVKSAKAWRAMSLPMPAIVQARPRLSWGYYPRDPWNQGQTLTLALRDEPVLIWDVPLRLRNALNIVASRKHIIVEMDEGMPQIICQHPNKDGLVWTGSDIRIDGKLAIEARTPIGTSTARAALTLGAGSKRWKVDDFRPIGNWHYGLQTGAASSGVADTEDIHIGKVVADGCRLRAIRINASAFTAVRRLTVERIESAVVTADSGHAHIAASNYCEDIAIGTRGGWLKGGQQAIVSNGGTVPLKRGTFGAEHAPIVCEGQTGIPVERIHGVFTAYVDIRGAGDDGAVVRRSDISGGVGPRFFNFKASGGQKRGYVTYSDELRQEVRNPEVSGNSLAAVGTYPGLEVDYGADNVHVTGVGYSGDAKTAARAANTVSSSGNPGNGTAINLNGSSVFFRSALTGSGLEVLLGATRDASMLALFNYLRASPDAQIRKCVFSMPSTSQITVTYRTPGAEGNAFAVSKTWTTGAWTNTSGFLVGGAEPVKTQSKGVSNLSFGANVSVASTINTAGNVA